MLQKLEMLSTGLRHLVTAPLITEIKERTRTMPETRIEWGIDMETISSKWRIGDGGEEMRYESREGAKVAGEDS